MRALLQNQKLLIALLSLVGITLYLALRYGFGVSGQGASVPLFAVLLLGGVPLVFELLGKVFRRELGADLLAGISIVTSVLLHEYLAGALVVLMLSGGEALEAYATRTASSVLQALARRMPTLAKRKDGTTLSDIPLAEVRIGDVLVVFPHALCPVDGTVLEGSGSMDESYLTGEPYQVPKTPGSAVLSGALNGEAALTIRCEKVATDSRYARILQVMRDSEQHRPRLRRLGDQLGAWYTPLAVSLALAAGIAAHSPLRFLTVLVIATPCPLLIAIPVAILGAISLAAKQGILIKDPAILEKLSACRVAIFDKTGTLTYGRPKLTETLLAEGGAPETNLLGLVASIARYSRHPLSRAILEAATEAGQPLKNVDLVRELPGDGLRAIVGGRTLHITGRGKLAPELVEKLPPVSPGLECVILIDGAYAATFRFRDEPRPEGKPFIGHLPARHAIRRTLLVSGDREAEVAYVAKQVGITEVFAGQSPEQKLALVRMETAKAPTVFLGDGINDAPALTAATVGIALGSSNEISGEAAGAVILDSSLAKVDILLHLGRRMRTIALQSAIGGMALSLIGMLFAATGHLTPVVGAVAQELIDILAVLNALRVAFPRTPLSDYA
ncbi:MAG: heavy metal translocating P-type ATPase [Armatimonas sp.]